MVIHSLNCESWSYGVKRSRHPALASVLIIGGLVVFMLAIIGLAINLTGFLDAIYMDLALTLPRFDYAMDENGESGNTTFDAFVQMRYIAGGVMGLALLWAGLARALEGAGIISGGTSSHVISRSLIFIVLFVVFPPMWDGAVIAVENVSLWVLNPVYTFDQNNPCPPEWSNDDILERYNKSPYNRGDAKQVSDAIILCEPQFKVRYVFDQMMGYTELEDTKSAYLTPDDPFSALTLDIQNFTETVLVNTFLGLTKALVTISVLIMAFVIGVMADLLVGMVMAAFPLLLMLTLIPRVNSIANRFLDALPALFLLPLLSAVVISVGAGFIAQIGSDTCVHDVCANPDGSSGAMTLYAWISSLGVVFFAVALPVLLVPLLGQVTQVATQAITGTPQNLGTMTGFATRTVSAIRPGFLQSSKKQSLSGLARRKGVGMSNTKSAPNTKKSKKFKSASLAGQTSLFPNEDTKSSGDGLVRGEPLLHDTANADTIHDMNDKLKIAGYDESDAASIKKLSGVSGYTSRELYQMLQNEKLKQKSSVPSLAMLDRMFSIKNDKDLERLIREIKSNIDASYVGNAK